MDINGINFDLEKAAQDIALLFAQKSMDPEFVYDKCAVENILQVYLNAYVQVASMDGEALKALLR